MNTIQLSEHFTLAEAVFSSTADRLDIDNSHPIAEVIEVARHTAANIEKVREVLGHPLRVDSWIRCVALNRALGSKDSSQHIKGEAVDFICPEAGTPAQLCMQLLQYRQLIGWDQLILEHTWVHISWNSLPNAVQRGQVLSLLSGGRYSVGLTDASGQPILIS